ncbi:MAG: hypothetical protein GTO51_03425 [Candidatus Latescibacteria bacterium]|nr:hypothetical protein [Candidatus Latescibacterota bacterium]NIM20889.1 hypothetical protein [Candidatus Latescibacterota bacterium]NIM65024.1 hypothetical protein [Candidatus Latescibacterota bacterium]NIO01539.1 hypothetical protein [Candidatus Latescibacterota bacterium]NIO28056.1 hypothetical protein [Candidatus Latescibacterota bacterium]
MKTVFVAGSFARNDIAWFNASGRLEIYSDLDIYVVISGDSDLESCRRRARAAASTILLEGEDFEIFPSMDVGVYTVEDLLAQPARPGTVEITDSHWVLYGDAGIPEMMRKQSNARIDEKEALYLLENRLIEKERLFARNWTSPSPGLERYAMYTAHKTCMDAGSALLIYLDLYSTSATERLSYIRNAAEYPEIQELLSKDDLDQIERSHQAIEDLQQALQKGDASLGSVWDSVEAVVLALWRGMAARLFQVGDKHSWDELVRTRCCEGDIAGNFRELVVLGKRMELGWWRSLFVGARNMRLSPLDSLRLSGLVAVILERREEGTAALERGFIPHLDRLSRAFGHSTGGIFERARELFEKIN